MIIPKTTGALLQRPFDAKDPVDWKVELNGIKYAHPDYETTINDIFRKIDLILNRTLDHEELQQFGQIVDLDFFKNVQEEDFEYDSKKFKGVSFNACDYDEDNNVANNPGLTLFGFKQVLHKQLDKKDLDQILEKMGYDESLYSTKARVIVCTLHSDQPLTCSITDAVGTGINERASDFILQDNVKNVGAGKYAKQDDRCVVTVIDHELCYGKSIGVINKTDEDISVTIDMTGSEDHYFTPKSGTVTKIIPGNTLKYMCSAVSNPEAEEIKFEYDFESEEA